ncbi:unnamed protein product, partial [Iphiclides podalirius]
MERGGIRRRVIASRQRRAKEWRRLADDTAKIRWQRSRWNSFSFEKCPVSVWHGERSCCTYYLFVCRAGRFYGAGPGAMRGRRGGRRGRGHTYYVINPRPPACGAGAPYSRRVSSSPRLTATHYARRAA